MRYNYWCEFHKGGCEHCNQKGDLKLPETGDFVCPNNEEIPLKLLGENTSMGISDPAHKKGRKPKEAKQRSLNDFKKNTLPYMGGFDRRFFEKKYGKPL